MIAKPLRSLQVGEVVYLEGCGIVRVLALDFQPTWVEVFWDRQFTGVVRRPDHASMGSWSAFYDDYPSIQTFPEEDI